MMTVSTTVMMKITSLSQTSTELIWWHTGIQLMILMEATMNSTQMVLLDSILQHFVWMSMTGIIGGVVSNMDQNVDSAFLSLLIPRWNLRKTMMVWKRLHGGTLIEPENLKKFTHMRYSLSGLMVHSTWTHTVQWSQRNLGATLIFRWVVQGVYFMLCIMQPNQHRRKIEVLILIGLVSRLSDV